MSRVPCVLPQDPLTSFSGVGALGRCQGIRASDPTLCGPCVSQLKLQADMGHLREEMMKTGRLQARERQTLAEWQAGARGRGAHTGAQWVRTGHTRAVWMRTHTRSSGFPLESGSRTQAQPRPAALEVQGRLGAAAWGSAGDPHRGAPSPARLASSLWVTRTLGGYSVLGAALPSGWRGKGVDTGPGSLTPAIPPPPPLAPAGEGEGAEAAHPGGV